MSDAELLWAIDTRLRVHEVELSERHTPEIAPADELLSAWAADPRVTRAQVERSRRIATGTWSGDQ